MIIFKKVRWKNLLSYGDRFTEIDLTTKRTTLVIGTNGAGKSTFLDALTFGLFGKSFRKIKKDQLTNTVNGKDMLVEVEFDANGSTYLVRRGIKPNVFEVFANGKLLNQNAKSRDYQKILEQQILRLDYKSFTQIVVLGSATFQPFMQLSVTDRKHILSDLLDASIFSVMGDHLKRLLGNSQLKIKDYRTAVKHKRQDIATREKFVSEMRDRSIDEADKKIAELAKTTERIAKMEKTIERKREQLVKIEEKVAARNALKLDFDTLNKKSGSMARKKNAIEEQMEVFGADECPTCRQEIAPEAKEELLKEPMAEILSIAEMTEKFDAEISELASKLEAYANIFEIERTHNHDINSMLSDLNGLQKYARQVERSIGDGGVAADLDEHMAEINQLKADLADMETNARSLVTRRKYYESAYALLEPLKAKIIRTYIPMINSLINKYLKEMEFYVSFHLDEDFTETLKSRYRDTFTYSSFSEGEKMRIDLALLFTWRELSKIRNSTNTNLMVLDEVTDSSLDEEGTKIFIRLLYGLDDNINTFVISHNETMRERFQRTLVASKEGNFSHLVEV